MELPAETYLRLAHKQIGDVKRSHNPYDNSYDLERLIDAAKNLAKARNLDPTRVFIDELGVNQTCDSVAAQLFEAEVEVRDDHADWCERFNIESKDLIHSLAHIREQRLAALQAYERLIAYAPDTTSYYVLATKYDALGEGALARETVRKGLEADPSDLYLAEAAQKWNFNRQPPSAVGNWAADHHYQISGYHMLALAVGIGPGLLWFLVRDTTIGPFVGLISLAGFAVLAVTSYLQFVKTKSP